MFDHSALRLLLRRPLLVLSSNVNSPVPATQYIEFENQIFIPPDTSSQQTWLRETYLPGDDALTSTATLQTVGIYQLDVFALAGGGTEAPDAIIHALANAYVPATGMDNGKGITLEIVRTKPLASKPFSDLWYMRPVQITFRSFTPNGPAGNVVSVAAAGGNNATWTFSPECTVASVLSAECIITVAATPRAPTSIIGITANSITFGYAVSPVGGTWALAAKPAAVTVPGGTFLAPETGGAVA